VVCCKRIACYSWRLPSSKRLGSLWASSKHARRFAVFRPLEKTAFVRCVVLVSWDIAKRNSSRSKVCQVVLSDQSARAQVGSRPFGGECELASSPLARGLAVAVTPWCYLACLGTNLAGA
jgi:hypothetical protein